MTSASHESETTREPRVRIDWGAFLVNFGRCYFERSVVAAFFGITLVFGAVFIYLGYNEAKLRSRSKAEPTRISCEDLTKHGPGDNLYIILTDFVLLPEYVYEEGVSGWKSAWIPAVSPQTIDRHVALALDIPASR